MKNAPLKLLNELGDGEFLSARAAAAYLGFCYKTILYVLKKQRAIPFFTASGEPRGKMYIRAGDLKAFIQRQIVAPTPLTAFNAVQKIQTAPGVPKKKRGRPRKTAPFINKNNVHFYEKWAGVPIPAPLIKEPEWAALLENAPGDLVKITKESAAPKKRKVGRPPKITVSAAVENAPLNDNEIITPPAAAVDGFDFLLKTPNPKNPTRAKKIAAIKEKNAAIRAAAFQRTLAKIKKIDDEILKKAESADVKILESYKRKNSDFYAILENAHKESELDRAAWIARSNFELKTGKETNPRQRILENFFTPPGNAKQTVAQIQKDAALFTLEDLKDFLRPDWLEKIFEIAASGKGAQNAFLKELGISNIQFRALYKDNFIFKRAWQKAERLLTLALKIQSAAAPPATEPTQGAVKKYAAV